MTRVAGELKSGKISVSSAAKECFDYNVRLWTTARNSNRGTDYDGTWRESVSDWRTVRARQQAMGSGRDGGAGVDRERVGKARGRRN